MKREAAVDQEYLSDAGVVSRNKVRHLGSPRALRSA